MRRRWLVLSAFMAVVGCLLAFVYTAMRFCGWLLLVAAGVVLLWGTLECFRKKKIVRLFRGVVAAALVVGMTIFVLLEWRVVSYGRTDHSREPMAVIVLGAGINGRTPSLSLQVRLQAALDYIEDKPDIPVVVSGGQGPGEEITEAQCMADWLANRGVDPQRIILEERAVNTEQNIRYSLELLKECGLDAEDKIAVVSADYHLYRAALYWGGTGMIPVAAHMPDRFWPLTVNYYIREAFGVAAILVEADQWLSALT